MFKFLIKGLTRDRSRTLFPILIIAAGVALTVLLYSWLNGYKTLTISENARFNTGYVKVVTRAYSDMIDQKPFDLGMLDLDETLTELKNDYPDMIWIARIYFGGLLDIPNEKGETQTQGEVFGMGVDLFSNNIEKELLNLDMALVSGRLPEKSGEILISDEVAKKLIRPGRNDNITIIGSTMFGSIAMQNFVFVGTVRFGVRALDRGAVIIDLADAQRMLDMENAAGEILGFFPNYEYDEEATYTISSKFNEKYSDENDEFSLIMLPLREQNNLDTMLMQVESRLGLIVFIFIFVMSLVLWNSGLMNGIRRYGEIGVRLAIGENKGHIYRSMIMESIFVGFVGSVIGTFIGLIISYYLQYKGINISSLMKDISIIMSTTMKAQVDSTSYYIGFIPGFLASVIGAMISGIGIYKRKTAQLFKELET